MEKTQKVQLIISLFEFYMVGIAKKKYTLNLREPEKKTIGNFINTIRKKYGQSIDCEEWFYEYFEFQFEYWYVLEKSGKLNVKWYYLRPSWIIGPKAYKRYEDFKERFDYIPNRKIRKLVRVGEQFKSPLIIKTTKINTLRDYEEKEKARFFKTEATLEWCIGNTTLYNPLSTFCAKCSFKKICIATLKKNYPKLSKRRLNEKA